MGGSRGALASLSRGGFPSRGTLSELSHPRHPRHTCPHVIVEKPPSHREVNAAGGHPQVRARYISMLFFIFIYFGGHQNGRRRNIYVIVWQRQSDLTSAVFKQLLLMALFVAAELFDEHWHLKNAYDLLVSPVDTRTLVVFG